MDTPSPSLRERRPKRTTGDDVTDTTDVSESELRRVKTTSSAKRLDNEEAYSPVLDIFRVLTFLILASCGLSYLISGGESYAWGLKNSPKYLQKDWWVSQMRGPLYLTPVELAAFDGTDETKPIYLAINGTIYDVSANRRTYGPGGSYHFFAGVDASRAYVTGCFSDDRTPDMRGVEDMFLPLDDPETDSQFTTEQLRKMRAKERADAKKKVHDALQHWVEFFAKSPKYRKVGHVKMEKDWNKTTPRPKLCDSAQQGRVKRVVPGQEA